MKKFLYKSFSGRYPIGITSVIILPTPMSFSRYVFILLLFQTTPLLKASSPTQVVDLSYTLESSKAKYKKNHNPWEGFIDRFSLNFPHQSEEIERQIYLLMKDKYHVTQSLSNMSHYLPWLLKEIKERNLPAELLVIPLIESCYEPHVTSKYGASGLWQIMPITAEHLNLESSYGFEPRHDTEISTKAALNYLEQLHRNFGTWVLALAAYNAGPSRVKAALKKRPYRHDMDFFKLDLPEQTLQYIPKILAFCQIIKYHDYYEVTLPELNDALEKVQLNKPYDFTTIALTFECPVPIIKKFNYQFPLKIVPEDSSKNIFLPRSFIRKGAKSYPKHLEDYQKSPYYQVKKGDNLLKIASYFSVPVKDLMAYNHLNQTGLKEGQKLLIPSIGSPLSPAVEYTVVKGDCLSKISRKYRIPVSKIMDDNALSSSNIRIGQKLLLTP